MDPIRLVVTHPGGAHKDDLLAVSVLVALHGCPVERREPTSEDLADPAVAVVDVGGAHDPARANFDHHQFPRDHRPTCSLSLVLDALGLYEDALKFCDWLETAEHFDSRGPKRTAEWLGVPRRAVSQLSSPIDVSLLKAFAAPPSHQPGELVHGFLELVGRDLVGYLRDVRAGIESVRARAQRWSIAIEGDTVETLFLPREDEAPDEPSASLARLVRAEGLEDTIGALVYPDRRSEGYGLTRYEDDPRLDFTRIEGEPDVHFAHASGFVAKTTATDPERLRALVAAAAASNDG
ncbi:MAG: MYG1 family protein [Planctomycetota bacterium]